MDRYLIISSRDPFEVADTGYAYDLATRLTQAGHETTLFLVQNGVLAARKGPRSGAVAAVATAGVKVLADDFSLRERGIVPARLETGVEPAPIDAVIDAMAEGRKVVWH